MDISMTPLSKDEEWFRNQHFWGAWLATCDFPNRCLRESMRETDNPIPSCCYRCGWDSEEAWSEATKRVIETRNE